jgi:hypothetical protein
MESRLPRPGERGRYAAMTPRHKRITVALLFVAVCIPAAPSLFVLACHAFAAIFPPGPLKGPHFIFLYAGDAKIHGVADDDELWYAVVLPDTFQIMPVIKHGAIKHGPYELDRVPLSLIIDRENPIQYRGEPVTVPLDSKVFALDSAGNIYPITLNSQQLAKIATLGSKRTSPPNSISDHDAPTIAATVADLNAKERQRQLDYLQSLRRGSITK